MTQSFRIRKFLLIISLLAPISAFAADMQPGLWEITTSMEMTGVNMKMPGQTIQHCYTPTDVADAKNLVPKDPRNDRCRITDIKRTGDTVAWKMACSAPHAMSGNGTITYSSNSYSGSTQMSMAGESGMSVNMTQKYSGKRIGDCPK